MRRKGGIQLLLGALAIFCILALMGCGGGGGSDSGGTVVTVGTVAGTVYNSAGNPLPDAVVTVESGESTTGADGKYSIGSIEAGNRVISVECDGYQPTETTVDVEAGKTVTKDFTLEPVPAQSGTVRGTVLDDNTGNPVSGVQVTIDSASAVSESDGTYSISGISIGNRTITAEKSGYINYSDSVTVEDGETTEKEIRMEPAPENSGSVTGRVTENPGGAPVAGVLVQVAGLNSQTDASGNYTINGITPGTQTIEAAKTGYLNYSGTVDVVAGETETHNIALDVFSGAYFDTLDDDNGGYVASGTNSTWQYGTPTNGPGSARSLGKCWATNLTGFYNNNEKSTLLSPDIDLSSLSGTGDIKISWYQWSKFEKGFDYLTVQVSNDGGTTWNTIDHKTGVTENSWTQHTAYVDDSYAVSDFKLRFCFYSDNSDNYEGVYIDDIKVETAGTGANDVDVYALIIGINDYPGTVNDLNWCVADALNVKKSLSSAPGWLGKSKIVVLTDSQAQKSEITSVLADFKASADANDLVVVTYSGHGSNDGETGSHAYLCVWNGTADGLISDVELQNMLNGMPCKTSVFLDCCHSGGMVITRSKDGKAENTARVMTTVKGFNPDFKGDMFTKKGRALDQLENIVGVSACTYLQYSQESSSLESGVFTYYLTQGFGMGASAGPADTNSDNTVSAEEVYAYLTPLAKAFNANQDAQMVDHYPSTASPGDDLIVKF